MSLHVIFGPAPNHQNNIDATGSSLTNEFACSNWISWSNTAVHPPPDSGVNLKSRDDNTTIAPSFSRASHEGSSGKNIPLEVAGMKRPPCHPDLDYWVVCLWHIVRDDHRDNFRRLRPDVEEWRTPLGVVSRAIELYFPLWKNEAHSMDRQLVYGS